MRAVDRTVMDRDGIPGSGVRDPGSGIRKFKTSALFDRIPDPGPRTPNSHTIRRPRVSGMPIHNMAAIKKANAVMENAIPKPRCCASVPITKGAAH